MTGHPLTCREADGITADWMRCALRAGGVADAPEVSDIVVDNLGAATNAFGSLLRCHLIARDGSPAVPPSVIVKLPTDRPLALRFAKWLEIHRREYHFYRHVAARVPIRSPALFYGEFDEDSHRLSWCSRIFTRWKRRPRRQVLQPNARGSPFGSSPSYMGCSGKPSIDRR